MFSRLREKGFAGNAVTLFAIFFIALTIRLVFISTLEDGYYFADSWRFERAADHLVEHGSFPKNYGRAPGYPVFLAGAYASVGEEILATRILQSVLSAIIALIITFIGFRTGGYWPGVFAGFFWSNYPLAIFVSSTIYPATLITTILAAGVMALLLGVRRAGSLPFILLAGFIFGLGALTKPIVLATITMVSLWIWVVRDTRRFTLSIAFALASIMTLVPWTVRNYEVHGRLVPIEARGISDVAPWAEDRKAQVAEFKRKLAATAALTKDFGEEENEKIRLALEGKLRVDSMAAQEAPTTFEKAQSMAFRMAKRFPKEFLSFFELYPRRVGFLDQSMRDRDRADKNPKLVKEIPFGTKVVMGTNAFAVVFLYLFAAFGIRAMWLSKRARRYLSLYLILIFSFAAGYATTWGKIRYRIPVDPYIMLLSAWGLFSVWSALALRNEGSPGSVDNDTRQEAQHAPSN